MREWAEEGPLQPQGGGAHIQTVGRGGFTALWSCSRVCRSRHARVPVGESDLPQSVCGACRRGSEDLPEQVGDPLSPSLPGARRGSQKGEMNGNVSTRR